jgi:hypothetical protein
MLKFMEEILNLKKVNCLRRLLLGYFIPALIPGFVQFFSPMDLEQTIIIISLILIFSSISYIVMNNRRIYIFNIIITDDKIVTIKYLSWFKKLEMIIKLSEMNSSVFRRKTTKKDIEYFEIGNNEFQIKQYAKNSMDGSEWDEELILCVYNQLTELKKKYSKEHNAPPEQTTSTPES